MTPEQMRREARRLESEAYRLRYIADIWDQDRRWRRVQDLREKAA